MRFSIWILVSSCQHHNIFNKPYSAIDYLTVFELMHKCMNDIICLRFFDCTSYSFKSKESRFKMYFTSKKCYHFGFIRNVKIFVL